MLWKLKQRQQSWLAREKGTIRKDWGGKVRVALAFPNHYAIGMSNLGFQTVYSILNQLENVVCERVFYPEPEDLRPLKEHPGHLLSVESQRPVQDFHLLLFSIPFENDYTHLVEMLSLSGIPPRAAERGTSHPVVAAGGVAVFLNPEPLAPFMDFMFIGEAEALLPDYWRFWNEIRHGKISREEFLIHLAREVPGIYVTSLSRVSYDPDGVLKDMEPLPGHGLPVKVAYRRADLAKTAPCRSVILTPNTEFSNVMLLEIGRGCGRGCRFCAAGYVYRPLRYHTPEKLLRAATGDLSETSRVGLVSAAVSDYPDISFLCQSLLDEGKSLSFSSLRADTLTPAIVSALESSQHQAVAIAPEAGSDRLRRVINKNLTADQIYEAVELLTERGILHLKLYFMIGLPTETLQDLEGIEEITKGIKHHVVKKSRGR
ncbi:MAG: radical SAM protein, partial [Deltaproteobacteria bacterium]